MNHRRKRQTGNDGPSNQLRIIAGKWRSRQLSFPSQEGLRPTGDRVRETLFNWLAPHLPGARCLDAFAGSGALGYEALSRGAASVVFLEKSAVAYEALRANKQRLEATTADIRLTDARKWIAEGNNGSSFDIIFIDPPFAENWQNECLALINNSGLAHEETLVYIEAPTGMALILPESWNISKEKQSGNVVYQLLQTS